MATSNQSTPPNSNQNDAATKSATSPNKGKNGPIASVLTIFALIIAMIAIAIAVYAIYSTNQNKNIISKKAQLINEQLDKTNQQNQSLNASLDTMQEAQKKISQQLENVQKRMHAAKKEQKYGANDWLLLKARYYLQLAQINAHWGAGQDATITLLNQADDLLSTLPDQRLFQLRQIISKEVAAIKAQPKIDTAGILSKLDAAQQTLQDLTIKRPATQNAEVNRSVTSTPQTRNNWQEKLKDSVHVLERLVIIRKHKNNIQPLLSDEQESILKQTMGLSLQEAQWAVLQKNQAVYDITLKQALNNLNRYFDAPDSATRALISQIKTLQKINLNPPKPNVSQSLKQLNILIEANDSQYLSPAKKGDNS